jgi:uncharacterized Ntn-hydrolase superfamily protein
MTYSLVACDPERRQWGVGVQSKFLAIGALTPWAAPEAGAVATQSFIRTVYGSKGLELLRAGLPARAVLERLMSDDPEPERRQVGIVDRDGRTATHLGADCLEWAGHRTGRGFAAQGNMLVSRRTVEAIATTFEASAGEPLAHRLLAALDAGQAAGGDRRGQQAAALLVVERGGGYGGSDTLVDLRVDDHPQPLTELRRLLGLHELYFGWTPDDRWLPVDATLRAELRARLDARGFGSGNLTVDLETWAGVENLEERVRGADRIDPVVLEELRKQ